MSDIKLQRSLDRWAGCNASAIADGSKAQMIYFVEDAKKDIALLAALAGKPVAIKPLEWVQRRPAVIGAGDYEITDMTDGRWRGNFPDECTYLWFVSLEAAKAAAQSDYEARICGALVSPPADKQRALIETLEAEVERLRQREESAREFVKRHPSLSLIDLAEFEAFLKLPEILGPRIDEAMAAFKKEITQ